jgi:hypothetical protein
MERPMNVSRWTTPATFFPWPHVQCGIDQIDAQVYRTAMDYAQEELGGTAKACSGCGRSSEDLFWVSITSPEADWDTGTGRVGFLTVCDRCRLQVDFLVDPELTDMQAEQWRDHRTLY